MGIFSKSTDSVLEAEASIAEAKAVADFERGHTSVQGMSEEASGGYLYFIDFKLQYKPDVNKLPENLPEEEKDKMKDMIMVMEGSTEVRLNHTIRSMRDIAEVQDKIKKDLPPGTQVQSVTIHNWRRFED